LEKNYLREQIEVFYTQNSQSSSNPMRQGAGRTVDKVQIEDIVHLGEEINLRLRAKEIDFDKTAQVK
jgi:hypothetical protein